MNTSDALIVIDALHTVAAQHLDDALRSRHKDRQACGESLKKQIRLMRIAEDFALEHAAPEGAA